MGESARLKREASRLFLSVDGIEKNAASSAKFVKRSDGHVTHPALIFRCVRRANLFEYLHDVSLSRNPVFTNSQNRTSSPAGDTPLVKNQY